MSLYIQLTVHWNFPIPNWNCVHRVLYCPVCKFVYSPKFGMLLCKWVLLCSALVIVALPNSPISWLNVCIACSFDNVCINNVNSYTTIDHTAAVGRRRTNSCSPSHSNHIPYDFNRHNRISHHSAFQILCSASCLYSYSHSHSHLCAWFCFGLKLWHNALHHRQASFITRLG